MKQATEPSRPSSPPAGVSQIQRVSPHQALMQLLFGLPVVHTIATAVELGILDVIGSNVLPPCHIADSCGTPVDSTHRLLRALSVVGVVNEHTDERFSLTSMGKLLLSDAPGSFSALARLAVAPWIGDAYRQLPHAVKSRQSGFTKHHGVPISEWLAERPEQQALFGQAMSTFSAVEVELLLNHFDFSHTRHIVDVGGGHGLLLSRVLQTAPHAKGTLFDTPAAIEQARQELPEEMRERCDLVSGDFFQSVPAGGDLYLLKHVLHEWNDDDALKILSRVADAMPNGATVLVLEQGVAQPGVPNSGKILDIAMLAVVDGGRERTVEQHASLLGRAGLDFEREIPTPGPITLFVAHK